MPILIFLAQCGAPPADDAEVVASDPTPVAVPSDPEAVPPPHDPEPPQPAELPPIPEPLETPPPPEPLDPTESVFAPPTKGGKLKMRGASTTPSETFAEAADPDAESKEYHTVEVHYGTNRSPSVATTPNDRYGKERHVDGPMEYGLAEVSIPLHHRMGVVERPRWYRMEFSEDPKKHVVILDLNKLSHDDFLLSMARSAGEREKNEALLFIHGFNVDFDSAIRRTAQIAFDLDFAGIALAFSWPSQASLGAYTVDAANAEWSYPHLARFLRDVQEGSGVERLHVIAHSMGTRVLSAALAYADTEGFDLDIANVVLAAPDIDADIFHDQLLPKIAATTRSLTMYASSDDTALKVSQRIHGNARLGLSSPQLRVFSGMDTINASGIDTSMLGHSYYGSHRVMVKDLFDLIIRGLDPSRRELVPGDSGEWAFGELAVP